jgi:hypothetical protein
MLVQGRIIGALHEHGSGDGDGGVPDEERLNLLAAIADQLGVVLESARLRADQEATLARLQELDDMKTDFVAITSHELRTPLAGIRGFVDMLQRRGDDLSSDERAEYLGLVMTQTDRLIRLVDDLLVVSRVEAGKLTLEPSDVAIGPLLDQLVRALGDGAARVRVEAGDGAPATIVVDPHRLTQIVTNLAANALKYGDPDTPIEITWSTPVEGTVAFAVTDHGAGIPADELEVIFDRFHQRERHLSHTSGFGLGLYITKMLVEAMGGWIDVRSALGVGTTFTVTLPANRPLPTPTPRTREAARDRTAS